MRARERIAGLVRFAQMPASERMLVIEALLAVCRVALFRRLLPIRCSIAAVGKQGLESPEVGSQQQVEAAHQVSRALASVAAHAVPMPSCLTLAMAGSRLLRRRGVPSTMYLGVSKPTSSMLSAHAWLRAGPVIVTGKRNAESFPIIASFAEEPA